MAHFLVSSYRKKQAPETAIQGGNVQSTSTPSKRTASKMSHLLSPTEPVSEGEDFLMAGVEALADDLDLDPFEESFKSMDLATDAVQIDEDQANNLLNSVKHNIVTFNDMWVGVLHHVTGKHEWTRGKCDHGPLDATTSDKELMVPGSPPHEALQRIMFNRR
uniref:Uncharacterized protein n=2 Tax=Nothobranchius rachovii TaxID=451742 RepID=A0A1A8R5P0_9TELE